MKTTLVQLAIMLKERNKQQVKDILGNSNYHSDFDVWVYHLVHNFFFQRELVLFFSENILRDILIVDYILGNRIREYVY